ncbi:MAG TPA: MBL fold metallo-hydrolase [Polyangiaceae bacterium]|jgi:glyoxylase-like metal-dependent hydrolase (beta-lactamase superfamily II)|nr:MBL fold metallo-hydrolase [Polyangiaceae bacterium]
MIFEQIRHGGCLSYLIGCDTTRSAIVVDPELDEADRYLTLAAEKGLRIRYVLDTHTHADHFTASRELGRELSVPVVMHRLSAAPFVELRVEDGETLVVGNLRLRVLETPGHTEDSLCLVLPDRVLTGDTLLMGGTGRTDLPTGDANALYDSLFGKVLCLDDALLVYPAHDYKGRSHTTIGAERAQNPRLAQRERAAFVELMHGLDIAMPQHLTEALRTNRTGGKTVTQLIAEAARGIAFMSMGDLKDRIEHGDRSLLVLDVRERDAFRARHLPGALNIPRGELELRADRELKDPTLRILTYCEFGKISTLAAYTLRSMGFLRTVALDGGLDAWSKAGFPLVKE